MDLAASAQAVIEQAMIAIARRALAVTGRTHLCLAGGVALNCVTNGRLMRELPRLEGIWIQPAAGDAGGALGPRMRGFADSHRNGPNDVPRHRWHQFVEDCKRFLNSSWAPKAVRLGWDAMALFECAPKRPLDYSGSAGLLWVIKGGRLVERGGRQHRWRARMHALFPSIATIISTPNTNTSEMRALTLALDAAAGARTTQDCLAAFV
jgi:Carbamoyltransferase N-terminus